jgi:hypothetical protein
MQWMTGDGFSPSARGSRWLKALWFLVAVAVTLALFWACAALYFSSPSPYLSALFGIVFVPLVWTTRRASTLLAGAAAALLVGLWWSQLAPTNDAPWQADVATLPRVEFDAGGDSFTVHNIRDFIYTSEFVYTPRYREEYYALSQLQSVDLFLIYWGSPWIAHTIISFGFDDGRQLAVSIETRKRVGQEYSAIQGFFRQFTLTYVVATERDVIKLRTDYRNEDVYLYRLKASPEFARNAFRQYAAHINRLYDAPEWYNALTENCTTSIRNDIYAYIPNKAFDWRLLLNGHIDEMLYERGTLDRGLPFAELKTRSYVNPKARALPADADYSAGIRAGLPDFDG